jgi:hypothetical protein
MTSNDRLRLPTASRSLATARLGGTLARGMLRSSSTNDPM